jgi:hypothetical protein
MKLNEKYLEVMDSEAWTKAFELPQASRIHQKLRILPQIKNPQ